MHVRVLAAIAAAASAIMVTTPPAAAEDRPGIIRLNEFDRNCPRNYVCMFEEPYFAGGGFGVLDGLSLNDFGGIYFDDQMSSWINATRSPYCWFSQDNFAGIAYVMRGRSAVSLMRPGRDNTSSSLALC
ncbi:peptidase inhibitor family I36 protein [Streptomyces sp. NPDC058251]|uniref:peptidase inhibitor family I36 protein n=1 Tax=unclassified Streptomyces TaxID=2593676 RepID=UPI00365FD46C